MRSLRACLRDEPLIRLMVIADLWDAAIEATSPREAAELLAQHMTQPEHLIATYQSLTDDAKHALRALLEQQGRMPFAAFERRFGAIRQMGPGRMERERPWLSPQGPAEALWYYGFISRAFEGSSTPVEVAFIPHELHKLLHHHLLPSAAEAERASAETLPPATTTGSESRWFPLIEDLVTLLCHIQNSEVRLKHNNEWEVSARRELAPMLHDADGVLDNSPKGRFAWMLHLSQRMGWVRAHERRLRLVVPAVSAWLTADAEAQRRALVDAWLNDDTWDDLTCVPTLELDMTHSWTHDPRRERQAICSLWERWRQAHPATDVDGFVAFVKQTQPDFARPDGRYDLWQVRDARSGAFLSGFEHWDDVEGQLIRFIISRPLRWLEGEPLNDAISTAPPFRVTEDGRVIIATSLRRQRFQLARVADWAETRPTHYVYRLTPRALARARAQGIRISQVLRFLKQQSGHPLPKGLERALQRWEDRGAEVHMASLVVVRAREPAILDALLSLPEARRAGVERLSPTALAVRRRDADEIRALLLSRGWLADQADDPPHHLK